MAEASRGASTRVLIVEDNPADADLVRLSLEEADGGPFEAEHVATLAEALARVTGSARPYVVLLDMSLPDALGLEGLRRLSEATSDVPIVVLTGSAIRDVGRAAIHAGAQDYLTKGADAALVPRALRYAIERHARAASARLLAEEQAARAAAEQARERMAVLAAASTAVCHSLEVRHALDALASTLVPRFADWCAISVADPEQEQPAWIVGHVDAVRAAAVSTRLAAVGAAHDGAAATAAIVESDGAAGRGGDVAAAWRAAVEDLGARSWMLVPLRLVDESLGVMVLGASGRRFGPDDLSLGEEIGRRAAIAVANCRLYREARRAVGVRDEFLAVAAHELKTPLTVLQLKLQQVELQQQASLCGTCEHAVPADYQGAARQISRLGHLVQELLDVSRIAGGAVKPHREELDLCGAARDAIERLAKLAPRSTSSVVLRSAGPVRGAWDRTAMDRILANLLSNALKFGEDKPVEVRVRADGEHAVVEVEDHGIGIAPEDIDRIFDQFERAVPTRHFGGLGLGLYIARRLVEAHAGSITAESRPGHGSLFTVRLPRAAAAETVPGEGHAS
jgi:signal transduction histidine kinase/CheY-like chemotaxis protein